MVIDIPGYFVVPDSEAHKEDLQTQLKSISPSTVRSMRAFMPSTKYVEVAIYSHDGWFRYSFYPVKIEESLCESALRILGLQSRDIYELETVYNSIAERGNQME